ncbi:MAG TPA: response regulator, partial [Candidatus Hydrogenedentes bacterium]|nr:response regulator [Candidatus Hydrogenedentota bacterium]
MDGITGKRALVVDDDPDIRCAVRVVLESAGMDTREAASAEEGLAIARQWHPDVVIADLMMEDINAGAELSCRICQELPVCPVILLSAIGNHLSQSLDIRAYGLRAVLQKPVKPRELLETVAGVLGTEPGRAP